MHRVVVCCFQVWKYLQFPFKALFPGLLIPLCELYGTVTRLTRQYISRMWFEGRSMYSLNTQGAKSLYAPVLIHSNINARGWTAALIISIYPPTHPKGRHVITLFTLECFPLWKVPKYTHARFVFLLHWSHCDWKGTLRCVRPVINLMSE